MQQQPLHTLPTAKHHIPGHANVKRHPQPPHLFLGVRNIPSTSSSANATSQPLRHADGQVERNIASPLDTLRVRRHRKKRIATTTRPYPPHPQQTQHRNPLNTSSGPNNATAMRIATIYTDLPKRCCAARSRVSTSTRERNIATPTRPRTRETGKPHTKHTIRQRRLHQAPTQHRTPDLLFCMRNARYTALRPTANGRVLVHEFTSSRVLKRDTRDQMS